MLLLLLELQLRHDSSALSGQAGGGVGGLCFVRPSIAVNISPSTSIVYVCSCNAFVIQVYFFHRLFWNSLSSMRMFSIPSCQPSLHFSEKLQNRWLSVRLIWVSCGLTLFCVPLYCSFRLTLQPLVQWRHGTQVILFPLNDTSLEEVYLSLCLYTDSLTGLFEIMNLCLNKTHLSKINSTLIVHVYKGL